MESTVLKNIADFMEEMKSYVDMNSVPENKRGANFYTALFAASTKLDAILEQVRSHATTSPLKQSKQFNTDEESFDMDDILPIESGESSGYEDNRASDSPKVADPKDTPSEEFKFNEAEFKLVVQSESNAGVVKRKFHFCIFVDNVPMSDQAGHTHATNPRNACARIMHRFVYHPNLRAAFNARSKKIVTVLIKDIDKGRERLFVVSK